MTLSQKTSHYEFQNFFGGKRVETTSAIVPQGRLGVDGF